jgi:hypothetical protein
MDPIGDFLCGTAGGVVSKFVDFPFDTVKVRMQAKGTQYKSTWECVTSIARLEGVKGFYAGAKQPAASGPPRCISIAMQLDAPI